MEKENKWIDYESYQKEKEFNKGVFYQIRDNFKKQKELSNKTKNKKIKDLIKDISSTRKNEITFYVGEKAVKNFNLVFEKVWKNNTSL